MSKADKAPSFKGRWTHRQPAGPMMREWKETGPEDTRQEADTMGSRGLLNEVMHKVMLEGQVGEDT